MKSNQTKETRERSYYHDAYRTEFDATIVERVWMEGQPAVVLDHSYFYPTSGGQPHDTGTIGGVKVVDVLVREDDQAILHLLEERVERDEVACEIDWDRRFDHMQQHSGQHILSAAFEQRMDADTIGFHLGSEGSTIDLDVAEVTARQLAAVEEFANDIVWTDRRIEAEILPADEAATLALRKAPAVAGPVRIVRVEGFDVNACGGTHVRRAGEIGLIKVTKVESRGAETRIEFLCGRRALVDYDEKNALVTRIANSFTTGQSEIEGAIERLREETLALRSELRRAKAELLEYEANELYQQAGEHGELKVVTAVLSDRERSDMSWLARNLAERSGVVVLLGLAGPKCHLLFARADDVDQDMVPLLKRALGVLGSSSGGGRPQSAQGGGPAADEEEITRALDTAKQLLLAER